VEAAAEEPSLAARAANPALLPDILKAHTMTTVVLRDVLNDIQRRK